MSAFGKPSSKDIATLPVFAGGLFNVDQVKIWKEILNNEREMTKEWPDKWGYFKAPNRELRSERPSKSRNARLAAETRREAVAEFEQQQQQKTMSSSASAPTLAAAGRTMAGGGGAGRTPSEKSSGSVTLRDRAIEDRRTKGPRERYGKALTSNHALGWLPNLERFGAAQHGMCSAPDLSPEM